jgi:hypothetical protein
MGNRDQEKRGEIPRGRDLPTQNCARAVGWCGNPDRTSHGQGGDTLGLVDSGNRMEDETVPTGERTVAGLRLGE